MNTSRPTHFLSELEDADAVIPKGKLEYLSERTRNNLYSYIVRRFWAEHKNSGLTKAKLARRIGYDPARLNRVLGAPGNWTIGTLSDLLAGIAAEELVPDSRPLLNQATRNYRKHDWISDAEDWDEGIEPTENAAAEAEVSYDSFELSQ